MRGETGTPGLPTAGLSEVVTFVQLETRRLAAALAPLRRQLQRAVVDDKAWGILNRG